MKFLVDVKSEMETMALGPVQCNCHSEWACDCKGGDGCPGDY